MMTNYDKVKILVVGDSGVGKTSAVQLICKNEPLTSPSWTVGVSLQVKLHEYKAGTPVQKTYFIDLWDIGGSSGHRNSRAVFFNGVNGIVLVHDLSNRKSEANLHKWLAEIFNSRTTDNGGADLSSGPQSPLHEGGDDFDPEQLLGSSHPPILCIGTKVESVVPAAESSLPTRTAHPRGSSIAAECGADEIFLNCLDAKSLAPGSTAAVKLSRFFDNVIQRRFHKEQPSHTFYDRKKLYAQPSRLFNDDLY